MLTLLWLTYQFVSDEQRDRFYAGFVNQTFGFVPVVCDTLKAWSIRNVVDYNQHVQFVDELQTVRLGYKIATRTNQKSSMAYIWALGCQFSKIYS